MSEALSTREMVYIGLGALALYTVYRLLQKGKEEIEKGFDITSPTNYASRTADAVTESVTGEKGATIGNKLYSWLNPASKVRIEIFFANGDVQLANGQVLRKGWKVSADGTLTDADGKVLGKAG